MRYRSAVSKIYESPAEETRNNSILREPPIINFRDDERGDSSFKRRIFYKVDGLVEISQSHFKNSISSRRL